MEAETLAWSLTDLLAPLLPLAIEGKEKEAPASARALWSILEPRVAGDGAAYEWAREVARFPSDQAARTGFRRQVARLLLEDPGLKRAIEEAVARLAIRLPTKTDDNWGEALGKDDAVIQRLEMIYLLRTGWAPDEVARRFGIDEAMLLRLNASFCLAGVAGLMEGRGVEDWPDRLDKLDPILRRLAMVRLLRSGTPASVIGRQYGAVEEYVERLNERFSKSGALGILTEDDANRLNALFPPVIRICTYNLHGTHNDGSLRFRRIARELSRSDAHLAAFQEVISGAGIEDTSLQISKWLSSMTGYDYRSRFCYCHEYMEKYPEGVAAVFRSPLKKARSIDLTALRDGLRPTMPRNAFAIETEVFGRKVVLASVHLDHNADPQVRLAQGEKLAAEAQRGNDDAYCIILAGDFNDSEVSPVVEHLRSAGYVDAYRACHKSGGNTFPAGSAHSRIDYIFVKGHVSIVSSRLLPDDPALSDHAGVFAEIR